MTAQWACGLTTVPSRRHTTLPLTLASLCRAGFSDLRLFVDGETDAAGWREEFGLPVTARYPKVMAFGNWTLALGELLIRNPKATHYAIFQDDLVMCANVRQYLETFDLPDDHFLNLYTWNNNLQLCGDRLGWSRSDQRGRGAVALVFSKHAAVTVLTDPITLLKPRSATNPTRNIDGNASEIARKHKLTELVHNPSLTQHIGEVTTIKNNNRHPQASSFKGEGFDPLLTYSTNVLTRSALPRKR